MKKSLGGSEGEIKSLTGRLSNEKFMAKAPEDVIADVKEQLAQAEAKASKLRDALARMGKTGDNKSD